MFSRHISKTCFGYVKHCIKMSTTVENGSGDNGPKKKTIEGIYQKKSQLEHILLRPDTYIGSVETATEMMWVYDKEKEAMVQREIKYVPGLYKIFDEILVNAADNKQRDPKMDAIKIEIDPENNVISIWNNGKGIPVVVHKEENMYVPTMIFGHLLTSSNYDDEEEKVTGGRNGYGAKLCNIFSHRFTVETASKEYKKCLKQTWCNNMESASAPRIKDFSGEDFTKVIFSPDLSKFKMQSLDDDIVALMSRRAFDIAASTRGVKVYLNGTRIPIKNFKDYVDFYIKGKEDDMGSPLKLVYENCGPRWEIAITLSDKGFQQMSFVNSIATTKGGRHVDHVTELIVKQLIETLKKKNKAGVTIKPFQIKNHLWIFINCLINNPTFDSQTKENMTLQPKSFGSKCALTDKFITSVRIPKLEDANDAGTNRSLECTLILTEGDSAKSMAVSGLASIGRDRYGIFPLRGDDLKTLRYGKMMIMTDQDQDGSHIKGLLINFIHHNWPSLLKLNFVEEFITPIVKASKGNQSLSFFSMPEFHKWKSETNNFHTYKIKYYKGLGTSTAKEAKEYFENMARHRIRFKYDGDQDDQNIIMAFSKKCVDQRKDWLMNHMDETKRRREIGLGERFLYQKDTRTVSFSEFINVELVLYSNYDNVRSIPNMIDGFKPGQRKVVYTCLKRNDKREVKVAQLAGSVAEHSAYHHGEVSLMSTIINLAQNFVGSNNINILQPNGQFGTRLTGGKDAASPRYIFTMLSPLARYIFHKHDDALLKHEYDDNQKIEPVFYVPIIPMILVNGAEGIGTGWMTKIPNYNPREIIENLYRMMDGADPKPMVPYYKNFKGVIESCGDYRYVVNGEISVIGPDKLEITELPVGIWTQTYKESVLEPMLHGSDKIPAIITDYKEYNTDTEVQFIVMLNRDKLVELERDGLHKAFKLQTTMTITSMCAFDENLCLKRYDSVLQILNNFYKMRLEMYHKRKDYLEGILQAEASKLSNQARFIIEKCDGTIVIENKKKKDMIAELIRREYESDPVVAWKLSQNREEILEAQEEIAENVEDEEVASPDVVANENFDYLLGMTLWSLTKERKDELLRQRDDKLLELKRLQARTPISLWKEDLDNLLNELNRLEEKEKKEERKSKQSNKKPPSKYYNNDSIRRIVPTIDTELKRKIEKAENVSKDKKEGIKKHQKVKKEPTDDKDELDMLVEANAKSLQDRLGNSPEKIEKKAGGRKRLKQTILSFKSKVKKEKGDEKKDKDSDCSDDIDFGSISPPPEPRVSRRASSDMEQKTKPTTIVNSDSDDIFKAHKKPSSEELFDSLVGSSPEKQQKAVEISSEDLSIFSPPTKVSAKKKAENGGKGMKRQLKKKAVSSDSDSEEVMVSNKQAPIKKRKKKSESEEDNIASVESSPVLTRKTGGRARKPVSYVLKSDDDDSN
ncbi:PREDICTED: DNA topoisomerase 2 [Habropoda laboriosa]|uniref:DNA topoisomerase 2 n=1 Tax=Habropoda laboriosa TaxID=597456 RepID=UPI00083D2D96|nr:PREDICTED: DNA topoisomerase 2 [Habropoda laboriosa]